ncbi:hypothetical protein C8J56DRAFT_951474 [Mycena floridula]|nr:hypothetical protein C8J56DRAFT_951474 [Mycena floridula]
MVLTRRARQAQNSPLLILPTEIFSEIISQCDRNSKLAMCTVSKFFHQLADPLLYEVVNFDCAHTLFLFAKRLTVYPQCAQWVKAMTIQEMPCIHEDYRPDFDDPETIITHIFKAATALRELHIVVHDHVQEMWKSWSLPSLRTLDVIGDSSDVEYLHVKPMLSFLGNHPEITQTRFLCPLPQTLSPILLPNLSVFSGLDHVLSNVLQNNPCNLQVVELIVCYHGTAEMMEALAVCPRLTTLTIRLSGDEDEDVGSQALHHVSCSLPRLTCLAIVARVGLKSKDVQESVRESLVALKALRYFGYLYPGPTVGNSMRQRIANTWLKACPTLQECSVERDMDDHVPYKFHRSSNGTAWPTKDTDALERTMVFHQQS